MNDPNLIERSLNPYTYGRFSPSTFSSPREIVLVPWNSNEGKIRLFRSKHSESFFHLAGFYQPQISPIYCGVASAVVVLNALRLPRDKGPAMPDATVAIPGTNQTIPFASFLQTHFLSPETEGVKRRAVVEYREQNAQGHFRPGLSLLELKELLEVYGASVDTAFASETQDDEFRTLLKKTLTTSDRFLVIHFRSDLIGGIPRGHISPLGAYDEKSDSVLILDVAAHKGPWYWAPVSHVFQAMKATYDTQPRGGGHLVVSDR